MSVFMRKRRKLKSNLVPNVIYCKKPGDVRKSITVRVSDDVKKKAVVIGINPSIADDTQSDLTLTKTTRYIYQYGIGEFTMLNLYETVSSKQDIIKEEHITNWDEHRRLLEEADLILVAWGTSGRYRKAKLAATEYLKQFKDKVCCIKNRNGNKPAHPSRIAYEYELVYFFR